MTTRTFRPEVRFPGFRITHQNCFRTHPPRVAAVEGKAVDEGGDVRSVLHGKHEFVLGRHLVSQESGQGFAELILHYSVRTKQVVSAIFTATCVFTVTVCAVCSVKRLAPRDCRCVSCGPSGEGSDAANGRTLRQSECIGQ